ncbi:MAG: nuclear transport factor 2 family protein, partial [Deltaproteobacteria bacterium]
MAFSRDELEQAFRTYWRTGAVGEDWNAWADLFTEDCLYVEHMYGTMRGREAVRRWIVPIMEKYGEIYTGYEWHVVDPASGRIILYVQNRRDHPG